MSYFEEFSESEDFVDLDEPGEPCPAPAGKPNKDKKRRAVRREIFSWIRLFVIVFAAVFVLKEFVILNAKVPSGSMEETISTGDRLIAFRFSYWFSDPERGDIALFKYPVDESTIYVKRVIGLPGETINITDGKIYINGSAEPLSEDYLPEEWIWENNDLVYIVPEGCYFMLGDNRNNSLDSRFWAEEALSAGIAENEEQAQSYTFVPRDSILAKAAFTYYPHISWLMDDVYED